uniref:Pre-mRNA splicing Prp18-interacting factor n=1 Tax=Tanacetum cinerariifolium TaxID=118510 RepID=A0A6L2MJS9_TANCI|nr:hypothetical protein [Tanacetum cinerariifolium]
MEVLGTRSFVILIKTPDLSQRPPQNCPKCGNPFDGHYCQGCALLRKKFKEDLFTYCIENRILQNASEPSNDNTNVVNALQKPFVVKQDPSENFSQSPPQINHYCCYGCGDSLEDIFCHQCTCELCRKGARYGYNYLPKGSIIPDPKPCHNQNVDELPQTVPSFDPTCYSERGNSFTYIPVCYDDDDEVYTIAITPKELDNSLSMGEGHIDTILAMKSDKFIKYSVENLVPNPSESEGKHECDMRVCDNFTTFSNILFDADYDFSSSDDQSFYDEEILKEIYSNPLFDEEIISMKIDLHHFNAEFDLIESLLNHDSLIISSSLKIDSLFDEFVGELALLKSITLGINETDCDPKEETRLIKRLFDSLMEEIDLSFTPDDPMPPGIEDDDYDSERDILIVEELFSNDSLSLHENKSFHFDIPSSSHPPVKPPDDNT